MAARAEFAQYGLAGARIDRVAKTANASKERLYAHFGDKETLFRQVVTSDAEQFIHAVAVRPDAVAQFAGEVFDLARANPEHLRMITWARLEGLRLTQPEFDGQGVLERDVRAVAQAQRDGLVDPRWDPEQLVIMLFGLGMAWAHWPDQIGLSDDEHAAAQRRAAVVEAAAKVVAPG